MSISDSVIGRYKQGAESNAPRVEWADFIDSFVWNQGEHLAMIGPTGSGKTSLAEAVLPMRRYIVVLATKPIDKVLKSWARTMNFKVWKEWRKNVNPAAVPRRMIWPPARKLDSEKLQKTVFSDALKQIYTLGGWTVYIDELWWIANHLQMERMVKVYLQQGRSLKLTLVCATQRPAWVPLEVYDQSTHLFFWHDADDTNLKRISGIAAFDSESVRYLIQTLKRYEVLYINTRERKMMRTTPPAPKAG